VVLSKIVDVTLGFGVGVGLAAAAVGISSGVFGSETMRPSAVTKKTAASKNIGPRIPCFADVLI